MAYAVKEIFKSLQGEGAQAGRAAVFCRFSGCDLWSGREVDRARASCRFCDTDFVGTDGTSGGHYETAEALTKVILQVWGDGQIGRFVVLTGGEPLLQADPLLIATLHEMRFFVAVETNGMRRPPLGVNWLCVSPKVGTDWVVKEGNELKLVYPQAGLDPASLTGLAFDHFILQPLDGPELRANIQAAAAYCQEHPPWRLGLQQHKIVGMR
jgi:7-carboxy-7-deazaguanine synthase